MHFILTSYFGILEACVMLLFVALLLNNTILFSRYRLPSYHTLHNTIFTCAYKDTFGKYYSLFTFTLHLHNSIHYYYYYYIHLLRAIVIRHV